MARLLPAPLRKIWHSPIALGRALGYDGLTEELHGEAWRFVKDEQRSYIEFPRGHYKSSMFSITVPIWILMRDPSARIMLMSAKRGLAADFIRKIYEHLQGDINVAGKEYPLREVFPWLAVGQGRQSGYSEKNGLNIVGRTGPNKERSIFPAGVMTSMAGRHPNVIIGDDLQDEINSVTFGQRQKVWRAYQTLTPLAERLDCPIYIIGTPWAQFDLAWRLKHDLQVPTFRRTIWSGDNGDKSTTPPGEVNPEYGMTGWPLAPHIMDVDQINWLIDERNSKRLSYELFSIWYRCVAVPSSDALFDLDTWNGMAMSHVNLNEIEGYDVAIVDPGLVEERNSDPSGITVYRVCTAQELGLSILKPHQNVFVLSSVHEVQGGYFDMWHYLDRFASSTQGKRLRAVFIEDGAATKVAEWQQKRLANGVVPKFLKGVGRGNGKARRVMSFQEAILRRRVIRANHPVPGQELLKEQMLNYPKLDHDDVLDAAALVAMLRKIGSLAKEPEQQPEPYSIAALNRKHRHHPTRKAAISWTGM